MDPERINNLLEKRKQGKLTEQEEAILETWYLELSRTEKVDIDHENMSLRLDQVWANIKPAKNSKKGAVRLSVVYITTAAAALVIAFGSYFLGQRNTSMVLPRETISYNSDVPPGGNSAVLTLFNGKKISLSGSRTKIIVKNSSLTYEDGTSIARVAGSKGQNTITTPIGGQYNIELPDGTKVALNAASTITFPSSFLGLVNRRIVLDGEAYFEVAKDAHHPFIVLSRTQQVKVLGTHFNINSYNESSVKTTLLEGAVQVNAQRHAQQLKPGEQTINNNSELRKVTADLELETAWKNGRTEFQQADIKSVMSMLERWYNIETAYRGKLPTALFSGSVSRNKNISEVLRLMEATGDVHFKIEGRRVVVMD